MYDDSFKLRYSYAPIAISEATTPSVTNPHIHNEPELLYILEGFCEIKIGMNIYNASKGDMFIVNPLQVHSVLPDKNHPYHHRCICFDASLIVDRNLSNALITGDALITNRIRSKELTDIVDSLYSSVNNNERTLLFEVSAGISFMMSHLIKKDYITHLIPHKKKSAFLKTVLKFISINYASDISSKDVARELFYTQSHFCREFTKIFGVTFSKYLNMYRINTAKSILKTTDKKISEVAFEVGFSSAEYFCRCFKKHTGYLPKDYAKMQ